MTDISRQWQLNEGYVTAGRNAGNTMVDVAELYFIVKAAVKAAPKILSAGKGIVDDCAKWLSNLAKGSKGGVDDVSKLTKYTQSNLKLGNEMHKLYKSDLADGINRIKEFRLPSGKRIDYIDLQEFKIYELKPNNPRSINQGLKQLETYRNELEQMPRFQGITWELILETY